MTRIALGLSYDGAGWHGWQSQPHRRTVQDALEDALSRFADRPVRVACAGRTDTGVHALGQVVHFDCDARRTPQGWVRGVNALLPPSIAVTWSVAFADDEAAAPQGVPAGSGRGDDGSFDALAETARAEAPPAARSMHGPATPKPGDADGDRRHPTERREAAIVEPPHAEGSERTSAAAPDRRPPFDARFDAMARTYHYLLLIQPQRSPHWIGRAGWTHTPLDLEAMRRACASLVGTHDFSAFRSAECQARSPVKTMSLAAVDASGPFVRFTFRANAFLHHMVRNVVGTLVAIGRGREAPEWMASLIDGRDRTAAAPTFMPDGLYLARVDYPEAIVLPPPVPFAHVHAGFAEAVG